MIIGLRQNLPSTPYNLKKKLHPQFRQNRLTYIKDFLSQMFGVDKHVRSATERILRHAQPKDSPSKQFGPQSLQLGDRVFGCLHEFFDVDSVRYPSGMIVVPQAGVLFGQL